MLIAELERRGHFYFIPMKDSNHLRVELMGLVMVAHGQTLIHGKEISLFSEVTYPLIMMQDLFLLPAGIVNAVVDILPQ
ncbi:Uncharacterised protein [Enterobacter roggenkampii]|uniref:Uncharacterized protein n=1 Tax=Enterobacter roggenkampii TaxID=1812935 RepID=A0ABD7KQC2_9ENTR|nr:Uncharacterised protein [Enterobacter roggenkampii]